MSLDLVNTKPGHYEIRQLKILVTERGNTISVLHLQGYIV